MIIDIHAHYVSPHLIDEVRRDGARYGLALETLDDRSHAVRFLHSGERLRPFFTELCDLAVRLPYLDAQGLDLQVVSTWTDMTGDDLPPAQAAAWARLQNETLAADARAAGGRFEGMGFLPMQDVAAACRELDHLVKHLGLHSIEMCTSINGRDLDHPDFRPLWKRIADLDVTVLLHPPYKPAALDRTGDYFLNNILAYPLDTTIAASRLIFSGIMRDLPGLKCCLSHGGGFLPYQIGRLERGFSAHPACRKSLAQTPLDFLGSFYFDTLTHNTETLSFLYDMVGSNRLVYGSDYPFEMLDESGTARIRALGLSKTDEANILGRNASALINPEARHTQLTLSHTADH